MKVKHGTDGCLARGASIATHIDLKQCAPLCHAQSLPGRWATGKQIPGVPILEISQRGTERRRGRGKQER